MTELILREGNIFSTDALAIGHGVNTVGAMGAGIAKQFRLYFPDMYQDYARQCQNGTLVPGGLMVYKYPSSAQGGARSGFWSPRVTQDRYVYNLATQDHPGPFARYEWLSTSLYGAVNHAMTNGIDRIALPRIGSGIGGLDEATVERLIREQAEAGPVDIEVWTFNG